MGVAITKAKALGVPDKDPDVLEKWRLIFGHVLGLTVFTGVLALVTAWGVSSPGNISSQPVLASSDSGDWLPPIGQFHAVIPVGNGALAVYNTGGISLLDYGFGIDYTSNPDYVGPDYAGVPSDNSTLFDGDPPWTYGAYAPDSTGVLEVVAESEGNSHGVASLVGADWGSAGFQNIESYANQVTVDGQTLDCIMCNQFDIYGQNWGGVDATPVFEGKLYIFTNALPQLEISIPSLNLVFGPSLPDLVFPLESGGMYGSALDVGQSLLAQ